MARITVEDCLENVKNRFELVILAARRARLLMRGSVEAKVAWENDKATVVALREIAAGFSGLDEIPPRHEHVEEITITEISTMDVLSSDRHQETSAPDDETPL